MNLLQLLLALAPNILAIVRSIEAIYPTAPGTQKLDAAVKLVQGVVAAVPEAQEHVDAMASHAVPLINTAVSILNAAGIFKSSGQQAGG